MKLGFQTQTQGAQPRQLAKSTGPGFPMASRGLCGLRCWRAAPPHTLLCFSESAPEQLHFLGSESSAPSPLYLVAPPRWVSASLAHASFLSWSWMLSWHCQGSCTSLATCPYPECWAILWILSNTLVVIVSGVGAQEVLPYRSHLKSVWWLFMWPTHLSLALSCFGE